MCLSLLSHTYVENTIYFSSKHKQNVGWNDDDMKVLYTQNKIERKKKKNENISTRYVAGKI